MSKPLAVGGIRWLALRIAAQRIRASMGSHTSASSSVCVNNKCFTRQHSRCAFRRVLQNRLLHKRFVGTHFTPKKTTHTHVIHIALCVHCTYSIQWDRMDAVTLHARSALACVRAFYVVCSSTQQIHWNDRVVFMCTCVSMLWTTAALLFVHCPDQRVKVQKDKLTVCVCVCVGWCNETMKQLLLTALYTCWLLCHTFANCFSVCVSVGLEFWTFQLLITS